MRWERRGSRLSRMWGGFGLAAVTIVAAAVVGRNLGIPLGLDLFYKLWQPLFNPAIGILFLGAILSWLISKISQKFGAN